MILPFPSSPHCAPIKIVLAIEIRNGQKIFPMHPAGHSRDCRRIICWQPPAARDFGTEAAQSCARTRRHVRFERVKRFSTLNLRFVRWLCSPTETRLFPACGVAGSPTEALLLARREPPLLPAEKPLALAFQTRSSSVERERSLPISWFANSVRAVRSSVEREFPFPSAPQRRKR